MMPLALGAVVFFTLALVMREIQLSRERTIHNAIQDKLRQALEQSRAQLRHTVEDLYVLQAVLIERNLVDEAELARSRARLIEAPRRRAEERDALERHLGGPPAQIIVDDSDGKLH